MFTRLAAVLLMAISAGSAAQSQKRIAFAAGINAYDNLGPERQLAKAVGDARAIAATLQDIGFQAAAHENLRRSEFNRAWQVFLARIEPGDTVAVFFAGHGVQVGGLNYLLPRDVPKLGGGEEGLLKDESIALQKLLDEVKERKPRLVLAIVDACRDNPFPLPGGRSVGGGRGLARIEPPEGTFVMLSAGAGEVALDRLPGNDPSPTSVYTRSLLPLLKRPDVSLQEVAVQVRDAVGTIASSIGHRQSPAYWDELRGPRVCLAGPCALGAAQPQQRPAVSVVPTVQGKGNDKATEPRMAIDAVAASRDSSSVKMFSEQLPSMLAKVDLASQTISKLKATAVLNQAPNARAIRYEANYTYFGNRFQKLVEIRPVAPGISARFERINSVGSQIAQRSEEHSVDVANGLSSATNVTSNTSSGRTTTSRTILAQFRVTMGTLFPVFANGAFEFEIQRLHGGKPVTEKHSCKVSQRSKASIWHEKMPGSVFRVACFTPRSAAGTADNYEMHYFDELGVVLDVGRSKNFFTEIRSFELLE